MSNERAELQVDGLLASGGELAGCGSGHHKRRLMPF